MIKIAQLISKDGAGVLFCLIGVIVQGFHTYFIIDQGSSLPDNIKIWQSIMAALFFSFGLLYFLFKAGKARSENNISDRERFIDYVKWFTIFEIFVNEHYWARAKIYLPYIERSNTDLLWYQTALWYDWSILAIFAMGIPLVLQAYARSIVIPTKSQEEKEKEILQKHLPNFDMLNGTMTFKVLADAHSKSKNERRMVVQTIKNEGLEKQDTRS